MDKADEALRTKSELKARRQLVTQELRTASAVVSVNEALHARSSWPDVKVPNRETLSIDRNWNFPLYDPDALARERAKEAKGKRVGRGASAQVCQPVSAEERSYTQVCYYCAQLNPAVRGAHTFIDCLKRKRAGLLEY